MVRGDIERVRRRKTPHMSHPAGAARYNLWSVDRAGPGDRAW